MSLTCLLLSLCAVFSTMLELLLLCDFVGAVAPDSFREPLRLVLLVINSIFIGFLYVSRVLPALPKFLISTGFESCSLGINKVGG